VGEVLVAGEDILCGHFVRAQRRFWADWVSALTAASAVLGSRYRNSFALDSDLQLRPCGRFAGRPVQCAPLPVRRNLRIEAVDADRIRPPCPLLRPATTFPEELRSKIELSTIVKADPQVTSPGVPRSPNGVTCESLHCNRRPKSDPRVFSSRRLQFQAAKYCSTAHAQSPGYRSTG
jgi:hypothetical protein